MRLVIVKHHQSILRQIPAPLPGHRFGDAVAKREATMIVIQARCRLITRSEVLEMLAAGGTI
jgi:hypothetical protein